MSEARLIDTVYALVRERITKPALPTGLTDAQWAALRYLANHPRSSLAAAADAMDISRPAASRLYKRLIKQGWVTRHTDSDDLRYIELDLTEAGRKLVDEIVEKRRTSYREICDAMDPRDREALITGARAFVAAALGISEFDESACLKCHTRGEILCPGAQEILRGRPDGVVQR